MSKPTASETKLLSVLYRTFSETKGAVQLGSASEDSRRFFYFTFELSYSASDDATREVKCSMGLWRITTLLWQNIVS